jgi:hypothetical protein
MDNHTTEAYRRRKYCGSDTNTIRNDERTCYRCGLPAQFKADCVHFRRAQDRDYMVNKGTGSASLATAGDRDQIGLADNATVVTAASAPTVWVIHSGASHPMCDDRTTFNSIQNLHQPTVIELGDDNKVTVRHHALLNVLQEYEVNAPYTPTFCLSLLSINQ